jgi:hypothetical protein
VVSWYQDFPYGYLESVNGRDDKDCEQGSRYPEKYLYGNVVSTKTGLLSMETGIGIILCNTAAHKVFTAMLITTFG